ncbi:MAG: cysteine hydrolase [Chloroflexota bacterium]|nr:cysteine hydrolase [Chloroflexota bacterium]
MANVVLVIDMVRGFVEPGHNLYCEGYRPLIPRIQELLDRETAAGSSVLFVSDHHLPDDLEFQIFPVHCVIGTEEPEVIPELAGYLTGDNLVPKNRYSGFFNTDLEQRLADLQPDKVIVCGVCTDICVLHTTSDARNRDYKVEIPADCVATFDPDAHTWALGHLEKILGATVI